MNRARRFYETVSVEPCDNGYSVHLDGKPIKTPGGMALVLPTASLAGAIADEWQGQDEKINPASMPMMQLGCTAIERVGPNMTEMLDQITGYARTDLICYFVEGPGDLLKRQMQYWGDTLTWLEKNHDVKLQTTTGIMACPQSETEISKFRTVFSGFDPFTLTAIIEAMQIFGSAVLALAMAVEHLDWKQAFDYSAIDSDWQSERWGEDHEYISNRKNRLHDIQQASLFLSRLKG